MKSLNLILIGMLFSFLGTTSCNSSDDLKQISGSLFFSEVGIHNFSINAENVEATVTIAAPNNGKTYIFKNVHLSNTASYTARIGENNASTLMNNLVVMYEAKSDEKFIDHTNIIENKGYVKIDWKGFD